MPKSFTERDDDDGTWVGRRNKRIVARGDTQEETGKKLHEMHPEDRVYGERVRRTEGGSPDKWRVLY